MYAIAYKETARSSWKMMEKVYEDREKVDAAIAVYCVKGYYAVVRVFFDRP